MVNPHCVYRLGGEKLIAPLPPPGQTNKWQSAVCQLSLQSFVFRNVIFATQALHSFGGHVLPRLLKIDVGRTGLLEFLFGNIFLQPNNCKHNIYWEQTCFNLSVSKNSLFFPNLQQSSKKNFKSPFLSCS